MNGAPQYSNGNEHLADELKRLDLLIRASLFRQRMRQPPNPLERFKGLVITEEEVQHLVASEGGDEETPEIAEIEQQIASLSERIEQRRAASANEGIALPLAALADLFSLNLFEENCVLIALAPELDRRYDKLYAYLHDDVTRKQPSVDLVLALCGLTPAVKLATRRSFEPPAPLLKYCVVRLGSDDSAPLISRPIKLDDRIVNYLLGGTQIDSRIQAVAKLIDAAAEWGKPVAPLALQTQMRQFVNAHFESNDPDSVVFHVRGPSAGGSRYLAECVCGDMGLGVLLADAAKMLAGALPFDELMWLLAREAALQPAVLVLENIDALLAAGTRAQLDAVLEAAYTFTRITFLFGKQAWPPVRPGDIGLFFDIRLPSVDMMQRKQIWDTRLGECSCDAATIDCGELASTFRLSPEQIEDAINAAAALANWRSPLEASITADDLREACRAQSGRSLDSLGRRIEPAFTWDDIVLPADSIEQLHELCERVKQRHRVLSEWGFARKLSLGRGINALFAGPSGTGKTMAAEIVANELGLDLYKIDLSGVVSKYIGETEKNLNAVFAAAEDSNAILFFDEADALFGKRSEVRDSHDRYANIEISYLLQKMEEYDGIAILATNLRQNLDESFVRRLAFTIQFPFPGEADRRRIWTSVWPAKAPLAQDLDFDFLAKQFKLSGGNIKNIAVAAAYLAAKRSAITMEHLFHATRREYQKLGKALSDAELTGVTRDAQPRHTSQY